MLLLFSFFFNKHIDNHYHQFCYLQKNICGCFFVLFLFFYCFNLWILYHKPTLFKYINFLNAFCVWVNLICTENLQREYSKFHICFTRLCLMLTHVVRNMYEAHMGDSTCVLTGHLGPTTWASLPPSVMWAEVGQLVIIIEPTCNYFYNPELLILNSIKNEL